MKNTVLKKGTKAFYDTFNGLIPCKVLSVADRWKAEPDQKYRFELTHGGASTRYRVTFQLTADRGAYRKGETLEASSLDVIPPGAVRQHQYSQTIGYYTVEADT
jgi:hypothetical protein